MAVSRASLGDRRDQHQSEQATRGSDGTGTITPRDQDRPPPVPPAAAGRERTTREELIAQALANMGPLTAEQRDQLSLLPPPTPAGPPSRAAKAAAG